MSTELVPAAGQRSEQGSAVVEFLALAVMLLIPTVWFLLAVSQVQAATYAAAGAADQAARVYAGSEASPQLRAERSEAAVDAALADFGLETDQATVTRTCSTDCEQPGDLVSYEIEIRVPLPLIPEFGGWEHSLVSVSASSSAVRGE
ncbi:hypothetical protein [Nesterenkonia muleiensis]|uniref:hypothetical protein n=1 Tax=Nesterenkonia muleiensis TaxID=2282648 RepID=UPI0013008138|nr:hypothetical protein [Nesterenkonia muleiensis]